MSKPSTVDEILEIGDAREILAGHAAALRELEEANAEAVAALDRAEDILRQHQTAMDEAESVCRRALAASARLQSWSQAMTALEVAAEFIKIVESN